MSMISLLTTINKNVFPAKYIFSAAILIFV